MKVLILAAGYGTRLYPHTRNFPKPLLKVGKKPVINYLLEKIEELDGISRVLVVTNNRFFNRFQAWKDSLPQSLRSSVEVLNDMSTSPEDKLGSVGDMHFVFQKENFAGDFLVLGGDNFFNGSLRDFILFARRKQPSISVGLFEFKDRNQARHFGVVRINKKNRIVEFSEKPAFPKSNLVTMCLYYFPQQKLRLIKEYLKDPKNSRDSAGSYIAWLSTKDKVYGYIFRDFWLDIGCPGALKKVERILRNNSE